MLGGYLEFFMKPPLADTYLNLKRELEELIQKKLLNPKLDIQIYEQLVAAVRLLILDDPCEGRFVFGRQGRQRQFPSCPEPKPSKPVANVSKNGDGPGGDNSKSQLQTLVTRAGHEAPTYKTTQLPNNQFRTTVEFNGMQFIGHPCHNKKLAEKDAAAEALKWLTGGTKSYEDISRMSLLLKKNKNKQHRRV